MTDKDPATSETMIARFQGERGRKALVESLRRQAVVGGDAALASQLAELATLRELATGEVLVRQDSSDNDVFLVLCGTFRIFVNGREIAARGVGQLLGEMAAIDPSSRRSATLVASEPGVVARIDGNAFLEAADRSPAVWRAMALELCRRLDERKKFHANPNSKSILFIGSSKESLGIAQAVAAAIPDEVASTILWSRGVFGASRFPIEDLEAQLGISDFALLVVGKDDQVVSRGVLSDAPRDNVVFELGLFMGGLSRSRTFILVPRGAAIKIPSDLLGLNPIHFDAGTANLAEAVAGAASELAEIIAKRGAK